MLLGMGKEITCGTRIFDRFDFKQVLGSYILSTEKENKEDNRANNTTIHVVC